MGKGRKGNKHHKQQQQHQQQQQQHSSHSSSSIQQQSQQANNDGAVSDQDVDELVELLMEKHRLQKKYEQALSYKKQAEGQRSGDCSSNDTPGGNDNDTKNGRGIPTTAATTSTNGGGKRRGSSSNGSGCSRMAVLPIVCILVTLVGFLIGNYHEMEWKHSCGRSFRQSTFYSLWTGWSYEYHPYYSDFPVASIEDRPKHMPATTKSTTTTAPAQEEEESAEFQDDDDENDDGMANSEAQKEKFYVTRKQLKWYLWTFWDQIKMAIPFTIQLRPVTTATTSNNLVNNPSLLQQHPKLLWDALVEMIVREEGGFVHPDLGIMSPAPSGAARGIGCVSTHYATCQSNCSTNQDIIYLKIPLEIQMTRNVALHTLSPLLPNDIRRHSPLEDLDDAILLTLLLAHEKSKGISSPYFPYITSLPSNPTCGYVHQIPPSSSSSHQHSYHNDDPYHHPSPSSSSSSSRNVDMRKSPKAMYLIDAIFNYAQDLGLDVNGWIMEMEKASDYAMVIAEGLSSDYGHYIIPKQLDAVAIFSWALCHVASRATAGNPTYGALRLVPILDMINHDQYAGFVTELKSTTSSLDPKKNDADTNTDSLLKEDDDSDQEEDTYDEEENEAGTFILRSMRHGKPNVLQYGQELVFNYNMPHYSPFDWFLNLGFVPKERWKPWTKIEAALPRLVDTTSSVNPPHHRQSNSFSVSHEFNSREFVDL